VSETLKYGFAVAVGNSLSQTGLGTSPLVASVYERILSSGVDANLMVIFISLKLLSGQGTTR
jgi:hypothetical protein